MSYQRKNEKGTMMNIPSVLKLIVIVFFLSILPLSGHALTPGQVFDKVKGSVVVVKTLDAQGKMKSFGSGVLLTSGRVATNCHVVEGGVSYRVGRGKQLVSATLYAEDADKDICILAAKDIAGKPAQHGKAAGLKVGDPVYAVGAPKGLELSLSDGIVAQLRGGPPPVIQTTAAISPGSSGGGLFDGEGRLVGLTTLYVEGGQSLNFAMPVEWIGEIKPGRKTVTEGRGQTEFQATSRGLTAVDFFTKATALKIKYGEQNIERIQKAIEYLNEAIRINPDYTEAYYNRGRAYDSLAFCYFRSYLLNENKKDYEQYKERAIENYDESIRLKPDYKEAYESRGHAYSALKQYQQAIKDYTEGIRIQLNQYQQDVKNYNEGDRLKRGRFFLSETYSYRANAYYMLGLDEWAIRDYDAAIRLVSLSRHYVSRGKTYYRMKQYQRAISDFDESIHENPDDAAAHEYRGKAYMESGNSQEGCRSLMRSCELEDCSSYNSAKQQGKCQ